MHHVPCATTEVEITKGATGHKVQKSNIALLTWTINNNNKKRIKGLSRIDSQIMYIMWVRLIFLIFLSVTELMVKIKMKFENLKFEIWNGNVNFYEELQRN